MNVLVLGSGGREHALAWKLLQSPELTLLFCAPGNPGTAALGPKVENHPVAVANPAAVVELCERLHVELVVVGPEAPLVAGVSDALWAKGIRVFGPSKAAAALEGSKAFAKQVMAEAGVPTAQGRTFTSPAEAKAYARTLSRVVVKADGLAAGKGVIVAQNVPDAEAAINELSRLGAAAGKLVLEEVLEGEEISVIALCDGERCVLLPPAQDHKRVGEGDTGPNTGGMGAYSPTPFLSSDDLRRIEREVILPVLKRMRERGTPFSGALFAGLMLTAQGPKVLEFNCRLGDPETQVLMLQLAEDLLPLLDACTRGTLKARELRLHPGASVGVVLAAAGYPATPRLGDSVEGLGDPRADSDSVVFHSGTSLKDGQLVSAGGRVLTVCGRGDTLEGARAKAYAHLNHLRLSGSHFRRDIAARAFAHAKGKSPR
jgi:phosphoribosylamine---glycine ligase